MYVILINNFFQINYLIQILFNLLKFLYNILKDLPFIFDCFKEHDLLKYKKHLILFCFLKFKRSIV